MVLEVSLFIFQSRHDRFRRIDISLSSVDNGDITELEWDDPSSQDIHNVRSLIHQVDLGQDTDRPRSIWVHLSCHFQTVRVGQIRVGASDSENDGIGLRDKSHEHISNLLFDISRLVTDGDFGQTGQIDQRERENVWRKDPEVDWVR